MSVLVVRDALPVQRTAKSKQKCETVARGRKDERTPPAVSLTSFPSLAVVFSIFEPRLVVLQCQRGVHRGEWQR